MLKIDNYCWFLRASKPNACQQTDNFYSKLTTFTLVICTGFSITSTKIAQTHAAVRLTWFTLKINAKFAIKQKQHTQVGECML